MNTDVRNQDTVCHNRPAFHLHNTLTLWYHFFVFAKDVFLNQHLIKHFSFLSFFFFVDLFACFPLWCPFLCEVLSLSIYLSFPFLYFHLVALEICQTNLYHFCTFIMFVSTKKELVSGTNPISKIMVTVYSSFLWAANWKVVGSNWAVHEALSKSLNLWLLQWRLSL